MLINSAFLLISTSRKALVVSLFILIHVFIDHSNVLAQNSVNITCEPVSMEGWLDQQNVCYYSEANVASSQWIDDNNPDIYHTYRTDYYSYSLYEYDSIDSKTMDIFLKRRTTSSEYSNGTKIYELAECATVTVNELECASCSLCVDMAFSADCTNLVNGRNVTCESVAPLFLPLVEDLFNEIECTNYSFTEDGTDLVIGPFDVCFSTMHTGLSGGISVFPNGTEVYGDPVYNYKFNLYKEDSVKNEIGAITLSRTGEVCDYVSINETVCNSCMYCGNDTFSADCTNIRNGRNVTCEVIAPLFYPLNNPNFNQPMRKRLITSSMLGSVKNRIRSFFSRIFG